MLFFQFVSGNIPQVLIPDRVCEVGAMTKGNVPGTDRKNSYYICCPDLLKTKDTLNCLNSYKTRIGKSWIFAKTTSLCNSLVAMALLQWFRSNGFHLSRSSTNKVTIFLDDGLYQKDWPIMDLSQWKCGISCMNFFIVATGQ